MYNFFVLISLTSLMLDSRTVMPSVLMDQGNVAYTVLAPRGYMSGSYSGLEIDIIWYIEAESHMKVLFHIKGRYQGILVLGGISYMRGCC